MRLVIPDIPRSPNGPRGLLRMHWKARSNYNKYWQTLIRAAIDNSHKPCNQKMAVHVSQMRKRLLDPDNLNSSVKPLLDALVHWNLLKDDSPAWIELYCSQIVGKEAITIINIEAI